MTVLRLDKLSLTNFRCFAHCEVAFHPGLTVLVAENGSGKTAVLDAAGAALSVFVNALYPPEKVRRVERSDVRLIPGQERRMSPCLPTEYEAQATVQGAAVRWKSAVRTYGEKVRPSTRHFDPLKEAAQPFLTGTAVLPLIAYYGTGRLWSEQRQTEYRRSSVTNVGERVAGYADCLTSSSSFKGISAWFEHRFRQTASPSFREWNGVTHVVDVAEDGYRWRGATWRSLSAIAREITGAHWSGPRFFGLNGKAPS